MNAMRLPPPSWRRRALVAFPLLAAAVAAVILLVGGVKPTDLEIYRWGGGLLLSGDSLYAGVNAERGLAFTYPPFAAVLFTVLAVVPLSLAGIGWAGLSVAAATRSCVLLGRRLGADTRQVAVSTAGLLGCLAVWEPTSATLGYGQINFFLLWLVVEDRFGSVPERFAGALTGLAAGIKVVPGIFIAYDLVTGRRRPAAVATCAFLATVVASAAVAFSDTARYWSVLVFDAPRTGGPWYSGNQSVLGALARLSGEWPSTPVWIAICATLTGLGLTVAARWHRRGYPVLGVGLVALVMLLAAPITWSHHWVWALLLVAGLVEARRERVGAPVLVVALVIVLSSRLIWAPPHGHDWELDHAPAEAVLASLYVLLGIGVLLALSVSTLRSSDHHARDPSLTSTS